MSVETYTKFVEALLALDDGLDKGIKPVSTFDDGYDMKYQINRAFGLLKEAIVFEVDDKLKKACVLHKAPKNLKYPILPHKKMFVCVEFDKNNFPNIDMGADEILGVLLTETPLHDKSNLKVIGVSTNAMIVSFRPFNKKEIIGVPIKAEDHVYAKGKNLIFIDSITFNKRLDPVWSSANIVHKKQPTSGFIVNFVNNLLGFINDPDVQLVKHTRSEKNINRRKRLGKPVIPDSIEVKLTGKTKVYIDEFDTKVKKGEASWHYNYRFPVRSHKRNYRDKATGQILKTVVVREYTKGRGPLVEKVYKLEKK
jgi:hypothetical protein